METSSKEYKEHLENKYLPGRAFYLKKFFYPKIFSYFKEGDVVDLGFGTGEFLDYVKSKGRKITGIDSNTFLVNMCKERGFDVTIDDVTQLNTIHTPMSNAIIDNVLEHLDMEQINSFFDKVSKKMKKGGTLVVIVPDSKGYQRDPTHKTFVNKEIISQMCSKYGCSIKDNFLHPFNMGFMGRILYLNMQVFVITF
jgi:trans-aconitate methyltransferase